RGLVTPFVVNVSAFTGRQNTLTLTTGQGDDVVRVLGAPNDTTVHTGEGNDTVIVGAQDGTVQNKVAVGLHVDAGGGSGNVLYVACSGETLTSDYEVSATQIASTGYVQYGVPWDPVWNHPNYTSPPIPIGRHPGFTIDYGTAPGGAFGGGGFLVVGDRGDNSVRVSGTAANAPTMVFGGNAADRVDVRGDNPGDFQGDLVLVTGGGNDTVLVESPLPGVRLRIDTGPGNDGVRVEVTPA